MGVGRNTVSNNETGKVAPRRIVLKAWALATGVNLQWLETGVPPVEGPGEGECANRDSNPEPADLESRRRAMTTVRLLGVAA
jgi:transcriptional regulator with XRE-family HTH domain